MRYSRAWWAGLALALALALPGAAAAQDLGLGLDEDVDIGADDDSAGDDTSAAGDDADAPSDAPTGGPPASPGDATSRAREEFAAGVACVQEHETACAEQHFRAALELRDAPAIRYNLASSLYDLGRYPEAARLVASVLADPETPQEVREPAELLQSQLRGNSGTLQISLSGHTDGAEVAVDGDTVPDSQLAATPVEGGRAHTVTVTRRGMTAAQREVTVEAGATAPVELEVAPTPEEVAAMNAPPPEEPSGEPTLLEDWRFWAVVGGGVALVAIIVIAAVVASENATVEDPIVGNYDPGVLRWE